MNGYFVDATGRKAIPQWAYIASPARLAELENLIDSRSLPNAAHLHTLLDTVRTAPLVARTDVQSDYGLVTDDKGTHVHALVTAGNFASALQTAQLRVPFATVQQNLDSGPRIIKALKQWNKALEALTGSGHSSKRTRATFGLAGVARYQLLKRGLANESVRLVPFEPENDFASVDSFALFTCYEHQGVRHEGYLTNAMDLGPLSRAKIYETLASASTAMARAQSVLRFEDVQVVKLHMAVSGVSEVLRSAHPLIHTDVANSSIVQVAANVQRQAIEDALKQASDEQIIARWNALQAQNPSSSKPRKL